MKRIDRLLGIALGIIAVFCAPGRALGNDLKTTLFDSTEALIEKAKDKQADLLSPENYRKALERYQHAENAFKQGKRLDDIREDLYNADSHLQTALETSRLSAITFAPVLEARAHARIANAPKLSAKFWHEAEDAFGEAARGMEDGDVKKAQNRVGGVVHQYRKAEIDALKNHYLTDARGLIFHAEHLDADKYAPATLGKARGAVKLVESKLNRPDYDKDEVARLSNQATATARHAVQLALTVRALSNEQNLEKFVIQWEDRLGQIAKTADVKPRAESDQDKLTAQIVEKIRTYRTRIQKLDDRLSKSDNRVKNLQTHLGELKGKLEDQADARERVAKVEQMFHEGEATVLREGRDLIIRLYGLQFHAGRANIEPEYFYLLSKVEQAIQQFPDAAITLEGHTDSYGDGALNRALSEKRADAVRDYILANTATSPSRIKATGLGEDGPIASNDTPEGRSKNRRIDVVIHLNATRPTLGAVD